MSETALRQVKQRKVSRIAEARRRDLIEAAIRDIAAHGYNQVTIATICEEAGFSRGLIGHYFQGKDDLLLESVKTVANELGSAIRSATQTAGRDPLARIHALIAATFTPPGFTREKVAVWVSLTGAARWSPPLADIYREIWVDYRAGMARMLARAAQARKISFDFDQAALTFSQLVEGLWVGWAADPITVSPQTAEQCCHSYIDLLFRKS